MAAGTAVGAALVVSPWMPIGLAREVEPARGVALDPLVLVLGACSTVVFVTMIVGAATAVGVRRHARSGTAKPIALARAAARAGASPAAVSGLRLALERGSGSAVVPVLSSFASLSIAVAAIAGTLTFGAGLTHLRHTPRLVGWNWDIALAYPETDAPGAPSAAEARRRVQSALAAHHVDDVAMATIWSPFPEGRDLQVGPDARSVGGFVAFDGTARVGPSVISGRKPAAADEILLGPRTLEDLGLHVGDDVDVTGQAGTWNAPGPETHLRMRIVGTGITPMAVELGHGAVITLDGLRVLNPQAREQAWFVRVGPETERNTAVAAFRSAFPGSLREDIVAAEFEGLSSMALNLDQIGSVPRLFALIMALMAVLVLAHVLAVAARVRRHDLALLRALGFTRGQSRRTVGWQSLTYAVGAVAVGIPLGVAVGRLTWREYAASLGAVPEPVVSWTALAIVVGAAIALAATAAAIVGFRVLRTRPAAVLRAE
jgi:hypothetical protein